MHAYLIERPSYRSTLRKFESPDSDSSTKPDGAGMNPASLTNHGAILGVSGRSPL